VPQNCARMKMLTSAGFGLTGLLSSRSVIVCSPLNEFSIKNGNSIILMSLNVSSGRDMVKKLRRITHLLAVNLENLPCRPPSTLHKSHCRASVQDI
jgi:hypothetical protein